MNPKTHIDSKWISLRNNTAMLYSSAWSAPSAGEYPRKSTQSIPPKYSTFSLNKFGYPQHTSSNLAPPFIHTTCLKTTTLLTLWSKQKCNSFFISTPFPIWFCFSHTKRELAITYFGRIFILLISTISAFARYLNNFMFPLFGV